MGTPLNKFYRYLLTHKIRIPLQKQFGKGNKNRNIISGIITIIHSSSFICIVYIFYISDGLIILEISCNFDTNYPSIFLVLTILLFNLVLIMTRIIERTQQVFHFVMVCIYSYVYLRNRNWIMWLYFSSIQQTTYFLHDHLNSEPLFKSFVAWHYICIVDVWHLKCFWWESWK